MFGPGGTKWLRDIVTGTRLRYLPVASPTSGLIRCWWTNMTPDRWCTVRDFKAESNLFFFQLMWSCCSRNFAWENYTDRHILPQNGPSQSPPARAWPEPNRRNQQKPPSARRRKSLRGQGHRSVPAGAEHPSFRPFILQFQPCSVRFLAGPLKSRYVKAQRSTCFGVPVYSSDVVRRLNFYGQWRNAFEDFLEVL